MNVEEILAKQAEDLGSIKQSSVLGQPFEVNHGDALMAILQTLHRIELAMVTDDEQKIINKLAIQRLISGTKVEKA